jgi:hypothetical protein
MRLSFRGVLIVVASLALARVGGAQSSPSKPAPGTGVPSKRFCQAEGGFCFSYPASWQVLGQAFDNGVIVAPPQKTERALWDVVTVATVVPAPGENQTAPTVDDLISAATGNMQADGRNPQTLERQRRTVDGLPAQMIRLRYHDDEGRDWIEELVFIAGPEQEVYSVALKAQPASIARLEPAFAGILRSWKLRAQSAASQPAGESPAAASTAVPATSSTEPSSRPPNPKN